MVDHDDNQHDADYMMHRNGTCEVETVADKGAPAKEVGQAKPPSCVIVILKSRVIIILIIIIIVDVMPVVVVLQVGLGWVMGMYGWIS